MKRTYLLFSIVVAIALLLATSEVRAVVTPYPLSPGVATPPRECTINGWGGVIVKIEAGPATGPGLSTQFPLTDICVPPGQLEGQPCLKWQYRWSIIAGSASLKEALVSVDSDITVLKATTPVHVSKIIPIMAEGERFLAFPTSLTSFVAEYWTPLNVTPGTLTAGFVGNKLFLMGRCDLAGANNVTVQPFQAVPNLAFYPLPGCLVSFAVDSKGMPIPGTTQATGDGCEGSPQDSEMVIDGLSLLYGSPMQWTVEAPESCTTCWRNTYGGKTCVTTAACQ